MNGMFSRITDLFSQRSGLTVYYYHDPKEPPVRMKYRPGELAKPPDFKRDGYEIEGWYRSRRMTNRTLLAPLGAVLKRVSLYAKWRPSRL